MPVLTNRMKRALPLVAAAALVLSGCDGFTIEKTLGRRAGPNALGLRVGKQDPGATTDLGNGVRTARAAASPGTAALRPPGEREALGPRLDADTARPAGTCRALLAPEEAGAGNLPTGWTVRAVAGGKVPRVRAVRAAEGDTVLRIRSDDGAAFFYRTLDPPLEGAGSLRWRWRTSSPVQGADLREPDRDDSPLRVLVVFGAQSVGELTEGGRAVFYTWGNQEEPGTTFRSHVSDLIVVHVLRSAGDADGDWRTETRRPFEDYRDFLGREPRAIRALGFLPDTDQTSATAVAELGAVRWCPTREEGPLPSAAAGSSEPQG